MATSYADISQAIHERFANATLSVSKKVYVNSPFDPDTFSGVWARLSIQFQTGTHAGTGTGPVFRYDGLIDVDIFTPQNEGTGDAENVAGELRTLFRAVEFGCIKTGVDRFREVGFSGSRNQWFFSQFSVPFRIFEIN